MQLKAQSMRSNPLCVHSPTPPTERKVSKLIESSGGPLPPHHLLTAPFSSPVTSPSAYSPLHQPISPRMKYLIPTQEARKAPVTPLGCECPWAAVTTYTVMAHMLIYPWRML
ncbi:hypothetical protein EVAR_17326_1 [Eumeta japonica]|uniref:Uncharacterized protein n=1 Tax=Eumeta variegata TaxID=151549 RepID=A0A4C1TT69_EUMVA|nr:hypothetical protein EVAR_17326_1 [Eumeta japonica]